MTPVEKEREGCALIAEGLADKWEASAIKLREQFLTRMFFGLGPAYTSPVAERTAKDIEAAAHGLRTVAKLIREGCASTAFQHRTNTEAKP